MMCCACQVALADVLDSWLDQEFTPSTLTREQQRAELDWFRSVAEPFQGMTINVLSESIATHEYEADVLARAFSEITGITVNHVITREDQVIHQLWLQMISGTNEYDLFANDSDSIGTHFRSGKILSLSDFMANEGQAVTLPTLDIDDFIGLDFVRGADGEIYQLPTQQFANLYWFRYDWFERPDLKVRFADRYGYELGVPVNWSAYEDIAEFFTDHVEQLDGQRVYGHSDYGKRDPSLGWRFTDAWFSMAGAGDPGLPNGLPVDEWGIRVDDCRPVGSHVARGGATNAPASVYALTTYVDWLKRFAPPEAQDLTFGQAGSLPAKGNIAQQIFWYTTFTQDLLQPGLAITHADGTPKWRMAPSPHGAYWEEGMKLGYQDVGAWTIPRFMSTERQQAAWLYAQFTVSKTVSLKKTLTGLTPIRDSDLASDAMTEIAPRLGGLVEFYRSPAREFWTPTGNNVPDYPRLSERWWPNIADAVSGVRSPQEALDQLATEQDRVMSTMQRTFQTDICGPHIASLADAEGAAYWLAQPGAPKAALANEKPSGQTIQYDDLLRAWQSGRAR
ncbi:ABC transporter substrate-binding protein [Saccharospirillum impatiens]|uniref:ABC transporter substrate-binding protein n=1 Tax=Saccharospirillum impatiens TaxID=169438 RepID=UPI000428ECC6|nr:ABC transporter substrate-binding protein [Saccharospirillum impatiens]